jgi:hypothetical protein
MSEAILSSPASENPPLDHVAIIDRRSGTFIGVGTDLKTAAQNLLDRNEGETDGPTSIISITAALAGVLLASGSNTAPLFQPTDMLQIMEGDRCIGLGMGGDYRLVADPDAGADAPQGPDEPEDFGWMPHDALEAMLFIARLLPKRDPTILPMTSDELPGGSVCWPSIAGHTFCYVDWESELKRVSVTVFPHTRKELMLAFTISGWCLDNLIVCDIEG